MRGWRTATRIRDREKGGYGVCMRATRYNRKEERVDRSLEERRGETILYKKESGRRLSRRWFNADWTRIMREKVGLHRKVKDEGKKKKQPVVSGR